VLGLAAAMLCLLAGFSVLGAFIVRHSPMTIEAPGVPPSPSFMFGVIAFSVLLYLVLIWRVAANCSIETIRYRAAVTDEGAIALLLFTTAAAIASLAAVIAELGHSPGPFRISLGVGTVLLSWLFMHAIFALHYAHEFYGEGRDHRIGGLIFPGDEDPDYWDFLYYSLVVAMTAQVSDVQISSKTIRRLTTAHGVVSFFFNIAVLALGINIVSSLM